MKYPTLPDYNSVLREIDALATLKAEYGASALEEPLLETRSVLCQLRDRMAQIPVDPRQLEKEPDDLEPIRELRPSGPRKIWRAFEPDHYRDRLEGALLARSAGCTLGAIVEGWTVEDMEEWASEIGDDFPPCDYWTKAREPHRIRYGVNNCESYTRHSMDGVPVDDDLVYTQLGLLVLEKHGSAFTTEQIGRMWDEYLNWVWTDMKWSLERFRTGVAAHAAADGNPWQQMICAFIRCDPYGYAAAGWPELAAELSHRDGMMSHRRNGLYGGMFFAAAISAAFTVDDPVEAIRIGLSEIPRECRLAEEIAWALTAGSACRDYRDARAIVDERFAGMAKQHTINNACLVVLGIMVTIQLLPGQC